MPDFLRTAALEAAAKARNVSLASPQTLAGDGSDRRYYRLLGSPTVVLLFHPFPPGGEVNENDSYYLLGRHLRAHGAQESQIRHWYQQALGILVDMQIKGREGFDPSWCFDTPVLDRNFLWEREWGYFVKAFLNNYLGLPVRVADLAPDFERLLTGRLAPGPAGFLHRDFQSRNLFLTGGRLRVIDFQGGRLGPLGYDVASLLIDPYVNLSPAWQAELLDYYLDLLAARLEVDDVSFREQYEHLALCRNLQILGAYGYLTKVKGKDQFARYIPTAVAGLRRRLEARPGAWPGLEQVMNGGIRFAFPPG
jgi:aminoglycoside/choline kinase family phosphotransferase